MVASLLAELRNRDIRIRAEGNRLQCDAPAGALTPELREALKQRKSEIIEFLRTAETLVRQQRAVVPLQPLGTGTAVFGVGGHNGDVFCYRAFVSALGGEHPFFGLQPPGLDGQSEPIPDVEALARYFAEQVTSFRSDGPYSIAGFCAGGSIAFELARQLAARGEPVRVVALFGCPFPSAYRAIPQLRMRLTRDVGRINAHARALAGLSLRGQYEYIARKLEQRRARMAASRPLESDAVLALRARVEKATLAAVGRYEPKPFPGVLGLFLPNRAWADSPDLPLRWRTVAQSAEAYFGPDECNGDLMLREPYAPVFAELFRKMHAVAGARA
jgi:thioesterase domain-containing protein